MIMTRQNKNLNPFYTQRLCAEKEQFVADAIFKTTFPLGILFNVLGAFSKSITVVKLGYHVIMVDRYLPLRLNFEKV